MPANLAATALKILLVTADPALREDVRANLGDHEVADLATGLPAREAFDCVIVDARGDGEDMRGRVGVLRRAIAAYTYVVAVTDATTDADAAPWRGSVNAILSLPVQPQAIAAVFDDVRRLRDTVRHLGNHAEDFPSAGGIISRSAFNQIFLSGMDRAGRYNERPSMLFFRIANFREIQGLDGSLAADELAARLAQLLTRLRRQSDIIAQTGRGEFCILLQRPQAETETVEAARRFAESLGEAELGNTLFTDVPVDIELFELPSGSVTARHRVIYPAVLH